MADLYVALLHHPVYDKTGAVVTTAVTNLDVHDIARLARTFGVRAFYVCTPVATLRRLVARIIRHWDVGPGATYNATRREALALVRQAPDLDAAIAEIERETGAAAAADRDVGPRRRRASDATPRCGQRLGGRRPARAAALRDRLGAHRGGPRARRRRPRAHPGHRGLQPPVGPRRRRHHA